VTQQPRQSRVADLPAAAPAAVPPGRDGPAWQREEFIRSLQAAHGSALLGFALSELQGDRQAAEDIVQETMLRAWQHADAAGALAAPRSWLFTIAHRLVIDRWRRRSARPEEVTDEQLRYVGVRDHSDAALAGIVVREALSGLSEKYQAVIVHVYLDGRSVQETAAALGIPPGTVKSRLHSAVRALRAALEAKGATAND
jgi:RNA polymerase sigma-70 factor (ECF subfamily)